MSPFEFITKFREIQDTPYGPARIALCEGLLQEVLTSGERQNLPLVYAELTEAYTFGGEAHKAFTVFARQLQLWEKSPELFDSNDEKTMFWQFKWIAGEISNYVNISMRQIEAFLNDMERRFRLAGYGLMAPRVARFECAFKTGQPNAEELRKQWLATPDDEFNECPACVIGTQLSFFLSQQRWEEAVTLGNTQTFSCNIEPSNTHFQLMLAELMLGHPEQAAQHMLLGEATANSAHGSNDRPQAHGCLIEALGRGGALPELLECLRLAGFNKTPRRQQELRTIDALRSRIHIIAAISALLAGGVDPATATSYREPELATLGAMRDGAATTARELASAFDARNGNTFFADQLALALNATPAPAPLPHLAEFRTQF